MRNRAYIPEGQNSLTRQLTLERQTEVLCLRIYSVWFDPRREGIQGQVPIRRSKRHAARRPGEREVVGYGHASLDILERVGEAGIRRTRRGGCEWWSPHKLEGLLFLGTIVVNTIATPDAGLAGASRQPPAPPRAVGKSNARPKIVEGLGHTRSMNAGVALEDKADRSVGENDGLLSGPESEHSVPIVGHIYNRSVNLPAYAISDRQVRSQLELILGITVVFLRSCIKKPAARLPVEIRDSQQEVSERVAGTVNSAPLKRKYATILRRAGIPNLEPAHVKSKLQAVPSLREREVINCFVGLVLAGLRTVCRKP